MSVSLCPGNSLFLLGPSIPGNPGARLPQTHKGIHGRIDLVSGGRGLKDERGRERRLEISDRRHFMFAWNGF
ncbi:hypothetical protein HYQ46_006454 [Verticillium longisporum]|nr:hypothetical protein HYQ46_006454 [Verticillium longisporum]